MKKYLISKTKAVTLLELCIIIAIGAICVVPLLAILGTAVKNTANNGSIAKSIFLAQEKMEEILAMDFYQISSTGGSWDFWNPTNEELFVWNLTAEFINPNAANLGTTPAISGRSNYLRIRVTVQRFDPEHPTVPIAPAVSLVSLVTPHGY